MILHLMLSLGLLAFGAPESRPAADLDSAHPGLPNAFFVMDTATKDEKHQTLESQLEMVRELGFAGYAMNADAGVEKALALADRLKLKLFAIYAGVDVDTPDTPWDARLPGIISLLKGHDTVVWLFVTSKSKQPASEKLDEVAAGMIRRVAGMAEAAGVQVSLYPHNGFYMATSDHAVALARKADRKNVKLTFNLCHWLMAERGKDLDGVLKRALPYVSIVNINGSDKEGKDWAHLIRPLGDGAFDVYDLLMRLRRMGFRGPVGLQGYGITGDVHAHLQQAMRVWEGYRRAAEKK